MSRKSVVKTVVRVETKTIAEDMNGVLHAIQSGVVDVQTITTLKRLLTQKKGISTTSITISSSKAATLATSRAKKAKKSSTRPLPEGLASEKFPSLELVSAAKTVVMKSLTALATEVESKPKSAETASIDSKSRIPLSQGMRNIINCCKVALETLRQWQDREDIGSTWVNKAYFGYISRLISLEMVRPLLTLAKVSPTQQSRNSLLLKQKSKRN